MTTGAIDHSAAHLQPAGPGTSSLQPMGIIDSILNFACVLLWFNWRSAQLASAERSSPVSLVATLKKAEPRPSHRWLSLVVLVIVLIMRSVFYWNVGSAWNWTPSLELGVITLPFRSDYFLRILLFSVLSFTLILGALYSWLLLISLVNHKVLNDEPFQKLVRVHLGWVERWPIPVKLVLPMAVATLAWGLGSPALVQCGIVPPPISSKHLWQQALLLGLLSYLLWKPFLLGLCALYMVNSYVYLGRSHFWHFVHTTGSNLLRPLRFLPVCIGRVDFSPLLGIALVLVLTHWMERWLSQLFERLPL